MNAPPSLAPVFALTLALGALVIACGGAAPAPKSPTSMPEDTEAEPDPDAEPETIEEAEAAIAYARAALEGGPGDGLEAADEAPSQPGASPTAEPAPAAPPRPKAPGRDPCASPCRAIASMRRAVSALCRMTGDEDPRCEEARKTLEGSEARVQRCGC
jgi:hypothetical protein